MFHFVKEKENQQCSNDHEEEDLQNHGLLLESGRINFDLLSNALESFFGENKEAKMRGTGKHPTNSPMFVKFHE